MPNYDAYLTVNALNILTIGIPTGTSTTVTDTNNGGGENTGVLGDTDNDGFTANNGMFGSDVNYTYAGTVYDENDEPVGFVGSSGPLGSLIYTTFVPEGTNTEGLTLRLLPQDTVVPETQWDVEEAAPLCFMPGTKVRTPIGEIAVEALRAGDLVVTADGKQAPIRWIGLCTVSRRFADPLRTLPVRIKAGALAENVPSADLLVSPDHALMVDGLLVQAGALVNGITICRETDTPEIFTYYHVEMHDHALILAENTPAETFVDNVSRMRFDNWAEHEAIHGSTANIAEMDVPRVKSARQLPMAIRARLKARILAQHQPAAALAA